MLVKSTTLLLNRFYPVMRPWTSILKSEKILCITITQFTWARKKIGWLLFLKGLLLFLNCRGILTELTFQLFLYMVSHVNSAFLNLYLKKNNFIVMSWFICKQNFFSKLHKLSTSSRHLAGIGNFLSQFKLYSFVVRACQLKINKECLIL